MTALGKLKYIIATLVLFVLFILTTAFPITKDIKQSDIVIDTVVIDLTYGLLLLAALAFGGIATGISSVFGVGLYILLKNKSPWLALIALVIGLVAGITTKLATYLKERKKLDAKALFISAAAFYFAIGIIFTASRLIVGPYFFPAGKNAIRFYLILCILPFVLSLVFILATVFESKMQEKMHTAACKTAFMTTSVVLAYTIMGFLCSLSTKLSFKTILINTYRNYLVNFYVSAFILFLAAIGIYLIIYVALYLRYKFKNALKDVE